MGNQAFAESDALIVGMDVQLVDEVPGNCHEGHRLFIHLHNPDIVVDQDHIPKISLIFFEGVALPALEIREGLLSGTPPQSGDRVKIVRFIGTN